jgi:hypothetical protein
VGGKKKRKSLKKRVVKAARGGAGEREASERDGRIKREKLELS